MTVIEIQTNPLVTDDLDPYAGGWVAIRDGKVVAGALDPIELRTNPDVDERDALMPVPLDGDATFIL